MTLFVSTPNRRLEISEIYVMALSFILFYAVTRITRRVIEKRYEKKRKQPKKMHNPRGGGI